MSRWAPGKKTPKSVGRAYVGFWFHCSPNPNSLNHDCAHHGLESPLKNWEHRNLKKEWAKARGIKRVGMKKALEIAGIELEGPHHRALADVLNIAKLYADGERRNTPNAVPGCVTSLSIP